MIDSLMKTLESLNIPSWFESFAIDFRHIMGEMSPYLLFGFLFAGILSILIKQTFVEKHLGGRGLLPSVKASVFGVPLPLCSCGIIPVSASLRLNGASRGATTSFIISTPQTGVDSLLVTYSLLGGVFTVFRAVAAFISGILGGWAVDLLDGDDKKSSSKSTEGQTSTKNSCCSDTSCCSDSTKGESCSTGCCDSTAPENGILKGLHFAFIALPKDIGKPLIIGLIVTVLIGIVIPDNFFQETIGTGILSMIVMMLIAIPMYVCATASVPIAFALMMKGVSPGAALVFLMTGPATNAAAIATFWKVLGKKTTLIYLSSVILTSIVAGIILNSFFDVELVMSKNKMFMLPELFKDICSILLIANLVYVLLPSKKKETKTMNTEKRENSHMLTVNGMTCHHCKETVERTIRNSSGVTSVSVDLEANEAVIEGKNIDFDAILSKLKELGFEPELKD